MTWGDVVRASSDEWANSPVKDDLGRAVRAGVLEAFLRIATILAKCPRRCGERDFKDLPCATCRRSAARPAARRGRPPKETRL